MKLIICVVIIVLCSACSAVASKSESLRFSNGSDNQIELESIFNEYLDLSFCSANYYTVMEWMDALGGERMAIEIEFHKLSGLPLPETVAQASFVRGVDGVWSLTEYQIIAERIPETRRRSVPVIDCR